MRAESAECGVFDSIRRRAESFLLAKEHSEFEDAFRFSPNIFDEFVLATHIAEIQRHSNAAEQQSERIEQSNEVVEQLEAEQREFSEKLRRVNKSLAWRLIKPLAFLRDPDYRAKQKSNSAKVFGSSDKTRKGAPGGRAFHFCGL